ncbi:MAG: helix-turn-helix domain-containing protein [Chloroflexi bacterium]|nr:helix-turn-helix domain-containing protein [Chloroflexota bacterium]
MRVEEIRQQLLREREHALATRDPIAIRLTGERVTVIMDLLKDRPGEEAIDPKNTMLSLRQTARVLGFDAREVRKMIQEGRIRARKKGDQWEIPLDAIL